MHLKLHANAATTPRTRAYIRASTASVAELAAELGVSRKTVARWRGRDTTEDRSSRPKDIKSSLSPLEEELVRLEAAGLDSQRIASGECSPHCVSWAAAT